MELPLIVFIGYGVYAQRFSSDGLKVGSEIHVNSYVNGHQWDPAVASLSDGGFFVTWASQGQDTSSYGVYGLRFDQYGNTVGGETQLHSSVLNDQVMPDVSELSNGDLMLSWQSWHSGVPQIVQRRFVAPAGNSGQTIMGTSDSEIISGSTLADTLNGAAGDDVLSGGLGNDILSGGSGNDVYRFKVGDGIDTINNQDFNGQDVVELAGGLDKHHLWFSQTGYDLEVHLLGASDKLKFQNWFAQDAQKVDQFKLDSGAILDKSNIEQLVSAMAGFNPQAFGAVTSLNDLPQGVQATIAASWQN